jgi:hypothetical protein
MVAKTQTLRGVTGDTPLTGQPLNAKESAERFLGEWFCLGRAEAPISDQYWVHKLQTGRTPVQLKQWDFAMQKLWKDGQYIPDAIEALHPDLARVYAGLRAQGLHTGRVTLPDSGAGDHGSAASEPSHSPPPTPNGHAGYP